MAGNSFEYQKLLAERYPNVESAVKAIIDMSAELKLPKGTEYFFSDLHGENEVFIDMLRKASGVINDKINLVYGDVLSADECLEIGNLIAHPHHYLHDKQKKTKNFDQWVPITIHRLIQIAKEIASKYSINRVSGAFPKAYADILEPLLTIDCSSDNKMHYYHEIVDAAIRCGIGKTLIISLCKVIRQVAVDQLHILGDIYDRGPRPDLIMQELLNLRSVDIQWGNHDIDWIGAVAGNQVCMFSVLRKAISYNNFDCLEDGYGINLRPLSLYAAQVYADDPCENFQPHLHDLNKYDPIDANLAAKMHKAAAVIMFKLEGKLVKRNPEFGLEHRVLLDKIRFDKGTIIIGGKEYKLTDTNLPTVNPEKPFELTKEEQLIADAVSASFRHSEKLRRHIDYLITKRFHV